MLKLILIMIFSLNLFSQTPPPCNIQTSGGFIDCENVDCDQPGPWFTSTKWISLPEWPQCQLIVKYCYRVCSTNPVKIQVQVYEIKQDPLWIYCQDCANMRSFWGVSNHNLKILWMKTWQALVSQLYAEFIQGLINQNLSLDQQYCPNYKTDYTTALATCEAYCIRQVTENGITTIIINNVKCADEGCCIYSKKFCVEQGTNQIIVDETVLEHNLDVSSSCYTNSPPPAWPTECYNGTNIEYHNCEEECVDPEDF